MTTEHLLHPELLPIIEEFEPFRFSPENISEFRSSRSGLIQLGDANSAGVNRQAITISSPDTDIPCLLYTPKNRKPTAAYLHIHGGGFVAGQKEGSDPMNTKISSRLGVAVLAVGYRLAPEHPAPAGLNDCYAGLAWLYEQATTLGYDPSRIAIGGESAGGGLAAALAIHARDEGKYTICHQHLTFPMLDDRTGTSADPADPLVGEFVWNRDNNAFGWSCYLGDQPAAAPAVPARVSSVADLPPAWIFTVSMDLFRDENISYAQRLLAAGIQTELVVMPGACHGFMKQPKSSLARRYVDDHLRALASALGVDVAPGSTELG